MSAAMSAFIKAIRLRFTDDALYWLIYLHCQPDQQFRTCRRVLLASGEDNLSIPVMHHASRYLSGWEKATLIETATEVIRICKTKNWWEQETGHEYIKFWRVAASLPNPFDGYSYDEIRGEFAQTLAEDDRTKSALAMIRLKDFKQYNPREFAAWFIKEALCRGADEAAETLKVMLEHPKVFRYDTNHLAQAHFRLFAGELGEQDDPEIGHSEACKLLEHAKDRWKDPQPIPTYYLDGLHTSGKDRRFAGIPASMYGMCKAFKKYGRLHPDDSWPTDFWYKIEA
jgi:hypothetical protein